MTAAPKGAEKAPEENKDSVENAKNEASPAKTASGPRGKRSAATTAAPESTSRPGDENRGTEDDDHTPSGAALADNDPAKGGEAKFDTSLATPGPNDPVAEGVVQVTRKAEESEPHDPSGNVTVQVKRSSKKAKKSDPLADIDRSKLPVSVTVGAVVITLEEHAGNVIARFSLVGWVGEAPFTMRAEDITDELEPALEALREQL